MSNDIRVSVGFDTEAQTEIFKVAFVTNFGMKEIVQDLVEGMDYKQQKAWLAAQEAKGNIYEVEGPHAQPK